MAVSEKHARQKLAEFLPQAGKDARVAAKATLVASDPVLGVYKFQLGTSEGAVVGNDIVFENFSAEIATAMLKAAVASYFVLGSNADARFVASYITGDKTLPYGREFTATGGINFRCIISPLGYVAIFTLYK